MFSDSEWIEKEKALLHVIHNDPLGLLRNWGSELYIPHPQTVKRLLQSM